MRADIVTISDAAEDSEQIDRCGTIEKKSHRRHDVLQTAPIENIEIRIDSSLAAEEQSETAQIGMITRLNPRGNRLRLRLGAIVAVLRLASDKGERCIASGVARFRWRKFVIGRLKYVRVRLVFGEKRRPDGVERR